MANFLSQLHTIGLRRLDGDLLVLVNGIRQELHSSGSEPPPPADPTLTGLPTAGGALRLSLGPNSGPARAAGQTKSASGTVTPTGVEISPPPPNRADGPGEVEDEEAAETLRKLQVAGREGWFGRCVHAAPSRLPELFAVCTCMRACPRSQPRPPLSSENGARAGSVLPGIRGKFCGQEGLSCDVPCPAVWSFGSHGRARACAPPLWDGLPAALADSAWTVCESM